MKKSLKGKKWMALLLVCILCAAASLTALASSKSKQDVIDKITFDTAYLMKNKMVKIDCVNEEANHPDINYWLTPGGFTVTPVQGNAASGYYVNVTITPDVYVSRYSHDTGVQHVLEPASQGAVTLKFVYSLKTGTWSLAQGTIPTTFTVTCKGKPVVDPSETTAPEESTKDPGEETTAPEETTADPSETTAPEETTADPSETTAPEETTADPSETTPAVVDPSETDPSESSAVVTTADDNNKGTTAADNNKNNDNNGKDNKDSNDKPKTGDHDASMYLMAMFMASVLGAGVVLVRMRKED